MVWIRTYGGVWYEFAPHSNIVIVAVRRRLAGRRMGEYTSILNMDENDIPEFDHLSVVPNTTTLLAGEAGVFGILLDKHREKTEFSNFGILTVITVLK
jgi:hypothetical protein